MSTPPTPRYWPNLTGKVTPEAELAIKQLFNSVQDHDDALVLLKGQLTSAVAAQTVINETVTTPGTTTPVSPSNLGQVNNQTGTTYTTVSTDTGSLITMANAAPFTLTLSSAMPAFYCFAENLGPSLATLTPASGTVNLFASITLAVNQGCYLVFDGTNWKAFTSPQPAVSLAAVATHFLTAYNAVTGAFTAAQPVIGDVTGLVAALAALAPQASPTFTGTVTQPDATVLTAPTTASSATAGAATALPLLPSGYLVVSLGGTNFKLPYFAV